LKEKKNGNLGKYLEEIGLKGGIDKFEVIVASLYLTVVH
jgi:hypothetical protein